jgi:branched-chain amino acid transport system permease protein
MAEFLQYSVNGLIAGSSYGLLALAMTLIYGILSIPNFALGAVYALGAFIAFYIVQWMGPGYYLLSLVPAILIAVVLAYISDKAVFGPLHSAPHAAGFIAALGLNSILEGGYSVLFNPTWRNVSSPYNEIVFQLGPVSLTLQRVIILVICMLFAVGTYILVYRTMMGKKIRASSENSSVAQLMGISPATTTTLTFIIGCVLCSIAGVLDAPTTMVGASMGMTPGLKAFIVVTLGGLGSVSGAIVGGLILGLGENYGAAYISSMYKDLFAYGIFILVLLVLPNGLYRR